MAAAAAASYIYTYREEEDLLQLPLQASSTTTALNDISFLLSLCVSVESPQQRANAPLTSGPAAAICRTHVMSQFFKRTFMRWLTRCADLVSFSLDIIRLSWPERRVNEGENEEEASRRLEFSIKPSLEAYNSLHLYSLSFCMVHSSHKGPSSNDSDDRSNVRGTTSAAAIALVPLVHHFGQNIKCWMNVATFIAAIPRGF